MNFEQLFKRLEWCLVMSDNDRAAMTKQTSLPPDQMSWVLRILFVDASIDQGMNVFCLIAETMQ